MSLLLHLDFLLDRSQLHLGLVSLSLELLLGFPMLAIRHLHAQLQLAVAFTRPLQLPRLLPFNVLLDLLLVMLVADVSFPVEFFVMLLDLAMLVNADVVERHKHGRALHRLRVHLLLESLGV